MIRRKVASITIINLRPKAGVTRCDDSVRDTLNQVTDAIIIGFRGWTALLRRAHRGPALLDGRINRAERAMPPPVAWGQDRAGWPCPP